jgi:tetratricopeptide (TPR) repeat protein/tRNA A-37 threonylcarbamoyl transferase component Bud32
MSRTSPARWRRIAPILDEALDLAGAERQAFLARACGDDAALRADVEGLLDADARAAGFLTGPAEEYLAGVVPAAEAENGALAVGDRVGPFLVVRELARGGMGAVYLAERADGHFDQRVALKIMRPGLDSAEVHRRFLDERQILARLNHPHIGRLLDGGLGPGGRPWFAMEYVEGAPLTRWCAERGAGIPERLRLYLDVCDAVRYAHEERVVHRDLKPSNIFVTPDGQVKLLDFGIAKLLLPADAGPAAATRTELRALTPEYAAPEQIRGEPVTAATDVYALGAVLYELLTGVRVHRFTRHSAVEVERVVCETDPEAPSDAVRRGVPVAAGLGDVALLRRRLRGDLDTIALTALRKEPARRYPDAAALAADVRRHLAGEPIRARPAGVAHRAAKLLGRHRAVALGLAAVLVSTTAVLAALRPGAESGTRTPDALVDAGLHAFWADDVAGAQRLFRAALEVDSTAAMAAYHLSRTEASPQQDATLRQALRLAQRRPEWERRYIEQRWARSHRPWPVTLALAETLATRYPDSLEALVALGEALHYAGRFAEAVPPLERVVALDSTGLAAGSGCVACEAYTQLIATHLAQDSLALAERAARRWVAAAPATAAAWYNLTVASDRQFRTDEALDAARQASTLPSWANQVYFPAVIRIRAGRFAEVDRYLADQVRFGPLAARGTVYDLLTTSYRYQGRLVEALGSARRLREALGADGHLAGGLIQGQVLFEQGKFREARALFDSVLARSADENSAAGARARAATWSMLHVAAATTALGDTVRLARLADAMEESGAQSSLARDSRLHHHARGLLRVIQGRRLEAIEEFRLAMFSPTVGYTRTNLELGRLLLAEARPDEAIAVVAPALRGALDASNTYVTHTELRELLGRAYDAAGVHDSAIAQYRRVAEAWRGGDPEFRARAARAAARAARLERRRP